ncbi:hypothetical protein [Neisseria meningitidis]|uniref:hypothetical protein n=1 Tax=Neisseria meningitidis TaxID=487 RepID=UPI0030A7C4EF
MPSELPFQTAFLYGLLNIFRFFHFQSSGMPKSPPPKPTPFPSPAKNAANPSSAAQGNGRIRFPRRPTTGTATYPQSKATTGISNAATKKPTTSARFTSPPIPTTILYRFRAMLK